MLRTFRRLPRAGIAAAGLAAMVLLSGCELWRRTNPDERREANFVAAYNYNLQGAYDDAVAAYNRAIEANPNNAAAHWDLGFLYQDKFHDYVLSIYHFRRCQQIKKRRHDKEAEDPTIENAIRQGQIQLAIQFASAFGQQQSQTQLDDLKRRNAELEATIKELKLRLAAAQAPEGSVPSASESVSTVVTPPPARPSTSNPPAGPARSGGTAVAPRESPVHSTATAHTTPTPPPVRTHVVRSGDTMATIARKYGVTTAQLQSANRSVDPRKLKPGQSLTIPDRR
jgi:LysM repeat protein